MVILPSNFLGIVHIQKWIHGEDEGLGYGFFPPLKKIETLREERVREAGKKEKFPISLFISYFFLQIKELSVLLDFEKKTDSLLLL